MTIEINIMLSEKTTNFIVLKNRAEGISEGKKC